MKDIEMEADYPSNNPDGKVTVLDKKSGHAEKRAIFFMNIMRSQWPAKRSYMHSQHNL